MKIKKTNKGYNTRTSTKKTSKQENSIKLEAKENSIILLKKLLKTEKYENAKQTLVQLYDNFQISDTYFKEIKKNTKSFKKSGHSGSFLGKSVEYTDRVNKIFSGKMDINNTFKIDKCLKISNEFNEIFINLLINNLDKLVNISSSDFKKVKMHTLPLLEYGISNNGSGSYITIPLIGINNHNHNHNHNHDKILISNMRELLDINHTKLLAKAIQEDRKDILAEYDIFITKKLNSYLEVLRILQKYIHYINSDIKLTNVFIRKIKNTKEEWKTLINYGFITDFDLIIGDLEKSSIDINKLKITTEPSFAFKIITPLSKLIGKGLVYDIRYGCNMIMDTCSKINIFDYDLLSMIIDLCVQLLLLKNNILDEFKELSKCIALYLGYKHYSKLKNILEEGKYKINGNYSLRISNIIIKLCNMN
jgi:hypothetical protein